MTIHLITAGKYSNQENWPTIWNECFDKFSKTKHDICIWDDEGIEKLLKEDDNEFYDEYLSKLDPVYSWDYVRYIILGKYGGAYFDMDVELKSNFLDWLNPNKIYLAEGENNCLVNNHIMISPPEHVYWYNIRQRLKYRLIEKFDKAKTSGYWTIETVGPIGLSYTLAKEKYSYTPLSRYHFGSEDTALQLCVHHITHAWTEEEEPPYEMFEV